jgi:hypothetical protein
LIASPDTLTPTQVQPEIVPAPTIPITSQYCCTYNKAGTGQTELGFYIPPKNMGSTTIILPMTSQYDPETKVLGVSQQIFLPAKDASAISNWTMDKRTQICLDIESAFKKLQVNKNLSKALHNKVANNLAAKHNETSSINKNDELMRTMNSLFKIKGPASIAGVYAFKFGEGRVESGNILDNQPYLYDAVMRIPPTRSITLMRAPLRGLLETLASGTYGPTETVQKLVWGKTDIWTPKVGDT